YTESLREWAGIQFTCPANQVLTGRSHYGDENAITTYHCSWIYINDQQVQVSLGDWDAGQKESSSRFTAPADHVLAGRWHTGDENGRTKYRVATLHWQGKQVRLTSPGWSGGLKESRHSWDAGSGQVMTGRSHSGDENGTTKYQYATVTVDG
ncbi:hypothetical protein, partial [Streptosporangium carneum]